MPPIFLRLLPAVVLVQDLGKGHWYSVQLVHLPPADGQVLFFLPEGLAHFQGLGLPERVDESVFHLDVD